MGIYTPPPAYVVPRDGEKLNAKKWLGGAVALSRMQTDFADRVRQFGLERGIEGSKAKHQTVQQFYGQIERTSPVPAITPEDLKPQGFREGVLGRIGMTTHKETPLGIAERINAKIRTEVAPLAENASVSVSERRRAIEMAKTAKTLQDRLKPVLDALRPLGEENRAKMATIIRFAGKKLLEEQQEQQHQKLDQRQQRQGKSKDRDGFSR